MSPKVKNAQNMIEALADFFPSCFYVFEQRRRPLKVGISQDIIAALNGAATGPEIGMALRIYTSNSAYLRACRAGTPRIDLNGKAVGAVTSEEAASAKERLAQRRAKRARRQVTPITAKPETKPATRRISLADLRAAARARQAACEAAE